MGLEQLETFMGAISSVESGGNYNAKGPYTGATYGHARGRYQIMETIYGGWAKEAGVNPNDYSPAAQDRVARNKMTQYYKKYGSWDLVAVAWFAGPGNANKAQRAGVKSLAGASDMLGTTVPNYVAKVIKNMGSGGSNPAAFSGGNPEAYDPANSPAGAAPTAPRRADEAFAAVGNEVMEAPMEGGPDQAPGTLDKSNLGDIMAFIGQESRKRGSSTVLDLKALLGERMGGMATDA